MPPSLVNMTTPIEAALMQRYQDVKAGMKILDLDKQPYAHIIREYWAQVAAEKQHERATRSVDD